MAAVRDVRPSRWAPSTWVVQLEGRRQRLILEEETILRWGIKPGTELGQQTLRELQSLSKNTRLKEIAYRLLAWRPRSRTELEQRLLKAGGSPEAVHTLLDSLQQQGLVDDTAFANYWIQSRLEFRPRSRRELEAELRSKGLQGKEVRELIERVPEEQLCAQVAMKKARAIHFLPRPEFRRRLLQYLLRRGFEYQTADRAVEDAWNALKASGEGQW
jgi:regulatory protein